MDVVLIQNIDMITTLNKLFYLYVDPCQMDRM